jgi:hypothetical protein
VDSTAFAGLEIVQRERSEVAEALAATDEVCEVHATTVYEHVAGGDHRSSRS